MTNQLTQEERLYLRKLCEPMENGTAVVVPAGVRTETLALRALDTIDALEKELEKIRDQVGTRLTYNQGLYHENEQQKRTIDALEKEVVALRAKNPAEDALNAIAKICDRPEWDYPDQIVSEVKDLKADLERHFCVKLKYRRRAMAAETILATIASQSEVAPSDRESSESFDEYVWRMTRPFIRSFERAEHTEGGQ